MEIPNLTGIQEILLTHEKYKKLENVIYFTLEGRYLENYKSGLSVPMKVGSTKKLKKRQSSAQTSNTDSLFYGCDPQKITLEWIANRISPKVMYAYRAAKSIQNGTFEQLRYQLPRKIIEEIHRYFDAKDIPRRLFEADLVPENCILDKTLLHDYFVGDNGFSYLLDDYNELFKKKRCKKTVNSLILMFNQIFEFTMVTFEPYRNGYVIVDDFPE